MKRLWYPFCLGLCAALLILPSCKKSGGSAGESNSIVVWHWMTDREDALLALAKKYKEQTGVNVQFHLYAPSDAYAQKVRVGAQTNTLPEVFGILGESRNLASFIEAGHVANLKEELGSGKDSWKSRFYEEALNTAYFHKDNQFNVPEGYYGIPMDVTTIPMIYNKSLFAKAGLDPEQPPQTWKEFLEAGKKLKAAGVMGFTSGWGESWLIYSLATDLAHNIMGAEKVMATFAGKVPYTDPQWLEVFSAFDQLREAGFADPSLVSNGNKSAERTFALERAGMTFNGSWAVNVYAGMNPNLQYAPFRPPSLNAKRPRAVWGGAGTVFSVNDRSSNKQLAIDFLRWLTSQEQAAFLVTQTKNLPSVKDVGGEISPVLQGFAAMMENSIHPNRFSASEDPDVQEVFNKGIQSILIDENTPQQVAEAVQKAKNRISAPGTR